MDRFLNCYFEEIMRDQIKANWCTEFYFDCISLSSSTLALGVKIQIGTDSIKRKKMYKRHVVHVTHIGTRPIDI